MLDQRPNHLPKVWSPVFWELKASWRGWGGPCCASCLPSAWVRQRRSMRDDLIRPGLAQALHASGSLMCCDCYNALASGPEPKLIRGIPVTLVCLSITNPRTNPLTTNHSTSTCSSPRTNERYCLQRQTQTNRVVYHYCTI